MHHGCCRVRPITKEDRHDTLAFNYDEQKELMDNLGAVEPYGESNFSTLERIWFRPTLEILGVGSGFTGSGIKTAIPAKAIAKLSARTVPGQDPEDIMKLIEAHVTDHMPPACNVTVRELGFSAAAYATQREGPVNEAAAKVLEEVYGKAPLYERYGATIPAMAAMQQILGIESTMFGFALGTDSVHAPNESYQLSQYSRAREAYLRLFYELGNKWTASDKTEL